MQKSIFFRRILALLILALLLWAVLTAVIYSLISRPVFTRIKVGELQPKAESLAGMAASSFLQVDPYFNELIKSSQTFFDAWVFVVDGLSGKFRNTALPDEVSAAEPEIHNLISSRMDMLLEDQYTSIWFTAKLRNGQSGEVLFVGVPVYLRLGTRSTIIGAVFFVQPLKELTAGLSSMNIALLVSSLFVFFVMIIPAYLATAHLIKPLRQTRDIALAMAAGDYSERANVKQKGEIGELAMAMNDLADNLESTFADLEIERNRLTQNIKGMSDGQVAVDAQGKQTHVNQEAFTMLGQDEDGLAGQVELDRLLAEAVSKKAPAFGRIKAGPNLIFVQAAPLTDDNQRLAGAVALLHDVTEAERLEQTRRDYVANISHELRSPLTAMRALLEPLSDGMVTDKADQARYYDILLHENIRLTELINDLLELSRLQAGNLPVNLEKLKLLPLLEDILLRYSPQAADQDLKLKITDNSAFCPPVLTDPDRVEQVLVILVDNAMKYTPAGGKVELDLDWNDSQVLVHVKDTGSGIAAEDIKHVFDRFFKADRAHQQPGTGLGLSIAREILHLMDQEISVQSQAGQGATFTFTLKRADQANGVYDGKEEEQ